MDYSKNPEMLQKNLTRVGMLLIFFILPSPVQIRHPPETMVCKNEFGTIQRGCLYNIIHIREGCHCQALWQQVFTSSDIINPTGWDPSSLAKLVQRDSFNL